MEAMLADVTRVLELGREIIEKGTSSQAMGREKR